MKSKLLRILCVTVATGITTQAVFRLSNFEYGLSTVFREPFDLVNFTVKCVWWFGVWFFYSWAFDKLGWPLRRAGEPGR